MKSYKMKYFKYLKQISMSENNKKYNIRKIYISAMLPSTSTRTNINIFDINKKFRDLCKKYNFEFIDHRQITQIYKKFFFLGV